MQDCHRKDHLWFMRSGRQGWVRGMLPDAPRLCSVDPDTVPEAEKGQGSPTPGGPSPARSGLPAG